MIIIGLLAGFTYQHERRKWLVTISAVGFCGKGARVEGTYVSFLILLEFAPIEVRALSLS